MRLTAPDGRGSVARLSVRYNFLSSELIQNRAHHRPRYLHCHAIQAGVALFEICDWIGADFVALVDAEICIVVERLPGRALRKSDAEDHVYIRGRGAPGGNRNNR